MQAEVLAANCRRGDNPLGCQQFHVTSAPFLCECVDLVWAERGSGLGQHNVIQQGLPSLRLAGLLQLIYVVLGLRFAEQASHHHVCMITCVYAH